MAKLYMFATSDKVKVAKTVSANRWIEILLGYDESDYSKQIRVRLNRPSDTNKATLWVDGKKIKEVKNE
jgi:hypothetical protein